MRIYNSPTRALCESRPSRRHCWRWKTTGRWSSSGSIPRSPRRSCRRQLSIFDPVLTGQLGYEWNGLTQEPLDADRSGPVATAGVQEFLPTGTSLGVTGSTSVLTINGLPAGTNDFGSTIAFNATQSLLRGFGTAVNLASVNQARIDVEISQYELRGFVQTLIAQVEETYWDYAMAERKIEIYSQSLALAQKQLEETQERIKVGDLAQTEQSAAEAEVALRREDLINARSTLAKTKLDLLRLVNPPGARSLGPGDRAGQPPHQPRDHARRRGTARGSWPCRCGPI